MAWAPWLQWPVSISDLVHPVDIDLGGIGDGRDFGVVLVEQHGFGCTEKTDIAVQGEVKAGTSEGEPTVFGRSGVAVAIDVGLAGVNIAGTERKVGRYAATYVETRDEVGTVDRKGRRWS